MSAIIITKDQLAAAANKTSWLPARLADVLFDRMSQVPGSVYTTLRDDPDSTISRHVGVFSTEELAQAAAQEDADWESQRHMQPDVPRPVITWGDDDQSHPMLDGTIYTVILTTLDVRTGQG